MKNFFKGMVVGVGGVSPGLSGSVLLVIFGLYQKTVDAIGTIFKKFKENLLFLIPLFLGAVVGVIISSKIIDFFLNNFPMQTRYTFLGLIIGTLPLFYSEVKRDGCKKKHYIVMVVCAILGFAFFYFSKGLFEPVENPTLFQSVILGFAVAASSIIPGVDSAAILSAFGLYELYVSSIANLSLNILFPAAFGLGFGLLFISLFMSRLLAKFHTMTFSVIFGLFISVIPSVLNESCVPSLSFGFFFSIILAIIGFFFSFYMSDIKNNNERIKRFLNKIKNKN